MNVSPVDSALFSGIVTQKNISYDIPVTWNNRVARSLIFLSRGKKGPFGKWLNQAAYYLPLMKPLFAQKGLPTDLAYLPLIESGFNSRAYSFAHASGIWQFIPSTGVYYGLRINYWLDERRDPIKATNAAISYLQKLYTEFGDWYLALAGYNCGERNVYRAFQKNLSYSFWELDVPGETKNYVPQFIAAVVVAKNAGFFGFTVDTSMVFDLDTVYISKCIDLKTIADSLSISLPELRDMNPHILHWCTPPDLKNVVLYLPHDKGVLFKEFYDRLPPGHATMLYSYRVGRGDNLGSLSRRFGVPVDVIKQLNKLRSNSLKVKSIVLLPIPQNPETGQPIALNKASSSVSSRPSTLNGLKAVRYRVRPKDTMWSLAKLFNVSIENICRWNNLRPKSTLKSGSVLVFYTSTKSIKSLPKSTAGTRAGRTRYLVKSGDNLSTVALRLGVSVTDLILWNNKSQRNPVIQPGEQLVYFK